MDISSLQFVVVLWYGWLTRGLRYARYVLYHWATSTAYFVILLFFYFIWDKISLSCPGKLPTWDPPVLSYQVTGTAGMWHHFYLVPPCLSKPSLQALALTQSPYPWRSWRQLMAFTLPLSSPSYEDCSWLTHSVYRTLSKILRAWSSWTVKAHS